jgi:hypothetical protein
LIRVEKGRVANARAEERKMLLPGLARTAQGSQDYQAARSLSVRTARIRVAALGVPAMATSGAQRSGAMVDAVHTLVGIINRDEEP